MSSKFDTHVLDKLVDNTPDRIDAWLRAVSFEIVGDVKQSFNTSPPGRTYTRGTVSHTASQPGYPPNVDIGTLRASIRMERVGYLHYRVTDGVKYGAFLEFGTPRMAKRPFMTPVIEAWRKKLLDHARAFGLVVTR